MSNADKRPIESPAENQNFADAQNLKTRNTGNAQEVMQHLWEEK